MLIETETLIYEAPSPINDLGPALNAHDLADAIVYSTLGPLASPPATPPPPPHLLSATHPAPRQKRKNEKDENKIQQGRFPFQFS